MIADDHYASSIAAWEDDGGRVHAGARGASTLPMGRFHRNEYAPTTYLPMFDQCSALWPFRRQPRGG